MKIRLILRKGIADYNGVLAEYQYKTKEIEIDDELREYEVIGSEILKDDGKFDTEYKIRRNGRSYSVKIIPILEKKGGGFCASIPELGEKLVRGDGQTKEEAIRNCSLMLEEYLEYTSDYCDKYHE